MTRAKYMSRPMLVIFLCLMSAACNRSTSESAPEVFTFQDRNHPAFTVRIYESEYKGYGYDIYKHDKLIIHQPHVPAIQGTVGFPSRRKARKVAMLVINKIENGGSPPALTLAELEHLGIVPERH